MARSPYACLDGTKVTIDNVAGPFRACTNCGCRSATVSTKPVGTHAGSLVCDWCNATTSWLGRDHLAAMLAQKRGESEKGAA